MITARPHASVSSDVTRNTFTTNGGLIRTFRLLRHRDVLSSQMFSLLPVLNLLSKVKCALCGHVSVSIFWPARPISLSPILSMRNGREEGGKVYSTQPDHVYHVHNNYYIDHTELSSRVYVNPLYCEVGVLHSYSQNKALARGHYGIPQSINDILECK